MGLSAVAGAAAARQTRAGNRRRGGELDARSGGSDVDWLAPPPTAGAAGARGYPGLAPSVAYRRSVRSAADAADLGDPVAAWHL